MLSSKKIAALKPRDKRFTVTDSHGLTLRVHPSGVKSWVLRLSTGGRVSDLTLGRWPEMSLRQARQEARRRRREVGLSLPRGYVFRDAFGLWCRLKRGRIASYRSERRMIELHLMPFMGSRPLDEITAPLLIHFEVAEACLSHVAGSTVSRAYQRSDYFEARRSVMAAWSAFVADCARRADFLAEILDPVREGEPSP